MVGPTCWPSQAVGTEHRCWLSRVSRSSLTVRPSWPGPRIFCLKFYAFSGASTDNLPPGVLYKVKATYKYQAEDMDELQFEVGEIIDVVEYEDPEEQVKQFLHGLNQSKLGLPSYSWSEPVPTAHCRVFSQVTERETPPLQNKSLFSKALDQACLGCALPVPVRWVNPLFASSKNNSFTGGGLVDGSERRNWTEGSLPCKFYKADLAWKFIPILWPVNNFPVVTKEGPVSLVNLFALLFEHLSKFKF